ncbi:hypothetical protein RJT34_03052 [Clitoria ternatea]|uniref:F-box domain-containing protein n=1 Tax=Clitoria ternatea TaxID=43366 RepID=A0AAN9KLE6_CLITE
MKVITFTIALNLKSKTKSMEVILAQKRISADFNNLPEGCIANILSFTTPRDICKLSLVSSTFRSAADSDAVWDKFLPFDINTLISQSSSSSSLSVQSKKHLYISLCQNPLLIDDGKKGPEQVSKLISRLVLPNTFIVPLSSPLLLHKTLLKFRVSTFYTSIFMAQQLNSMLSDMHVDVVKTGMLPSLGIVKVLCQNLRKFLVKALVVDPVMISTSGDALAGSSVLVGFWVLVLEPVLDCR